MVTIFFFFFSIMASEAITTVTTQHVTAMAATATAAMSDADAHRNAVTQSYCMATAIHVWTAKPPLNWHPQGGQVRRVQA